MPTILRGLLCLWHLQHVYDCPTVAEATAFPRCLRLLSASMIVFYAECLDSRNTGAFT